MQSDLSAVLWTPRGSPFSFPPKRFTKRGAREGWGYGGSSRPRADPLEAELQTQRLMLWLAVPCPALL